MAEPLYSVLGQFDTESVTDAASCNPATLAVLVHCTKFGNHCQLTIIESDSQPQTRMPHNSPPVYFRWHNAVVAETALTTHNLRWQVELM